MNKKNFIEKMDKNIASNLDRMKKLKNKPEDIKELYELTHEALMLYKYFKLCKIGDIVWATPADMDCEIYIEDMNWDEPYPLQVISIEPFIDDETGEQDLYFELSYLEVDGENYTLKLSTIEIDEWIYFSKEDAEKDMELNKNTYKELELLVKADMI